jgi:CDP-diacylglycerol--glycerol-3-phosphate 3-phosphatidyltransferase
LISSKIGHSLDPLILRLYRFFFRNKVVSPNVLTVVGLSFSLLAFVFTVQGQLAAAAASLLLSGFFDLCDGAVARSTNTITTFGGFLDSVLDRYSDLFIMFGTFIHFLSLGDRTFAIITFFAGIGVAIVPYARARAEAASIKCGSGLLERPERTVLLVLGLAFNILRPVTVILAVFTHFTVIQRIMETRRTIQKQDAKIKG